MNSIERRYLRLKAKLPVREPIQPQRYEPPHSAYQNRAERHARKMLEKEGYRVYRRGWPDFFCTRYKDGQLEAIAVEVKTGKDKCSLHQDAMHAALVAAGIPVHIYRLDPV